MLAERDGQTGCWERGRGKQAVSRGGGANRMLLERGVNRLLAEVEGELGC